MAKLEDHVLDIYWQMVETIKNDRAEIEALKKEVFMLVGIIKSGNELLRKVFPMLYKAENQKAVSSHVEAAEHHVQRTGDLWGTLGKCSICGKSWQECSCLTRR
jgi:hypothetical protein